MPPYTENYESLVWRHFLAENPGLLSPVSGSSGRKHIANAEARRIFCQLWFVSTDFRWGLVEANFFETTIVDFIDDEEARFFDRHDPVDGWHFEHFGLELVYEEIEDLQVRYGSLDSGAYPDGLGDEEPPVDDEDEGGMELTEVDGVEEEDFDFEDELDFEAAGSGTWLYDFARGPDAA